MYLLNSTKYRPLALAVLLLILAVLAGGVVSAASAPSRGDAVPAIQLPVNSDPASLNEAYRALNMGQRSFGDAMNAINALRDGKVAGVDFSQAQKDAIKDQAFGGLYQARERYKNTLAILDVTIAQLDAWELTNPQPVPCFAVSGVGDCSAQ